MAAGKRGMTEGKKQAGSAFGTLCNVLGTALVFLVIALLLPLLVLKVSGGNAFEITSGSMEPEIPVGSLVVVKQIDASLAAEGDIIAFTSGGSIVVHRVVENSTDAREIITKGDANEVVDLRPVPYENLIGAVTHHFSGLGIVMGYLTGRSGKIILLCLIGCGALLQIAGRSMKQA